MSILDCEWEDGMLYCEIEESVEQDEFSSNKSSNRKKIGGSVISEDPDSKPTQTKNLVVC